MSDTPKAGEVWVGTNCHVEYTLIGTPDSDGVWHARTSNGRNAVTGLENHHRKPVAPPSDVECWTNYYPGMGNSQFLTAEGADKYALKTRTWRFDAYNNWVPCQGKNFLGPAVKGRP